MTHAELVERAAIWLRTKQKCFPVFAEMVTYAPSTPDAIGWASGWSRLVEVKVSRADFFADRKKPAHQRPEGGMGRRRWYMTPVGLVRPDEVPPGWGLVHVDGRKCAIVVEAPDRELGQWELVQEARILTSAIRRLQLGTKLNPKTGRWETLVGRWEREASEAPRCTCGQPLHIGTHVQCADLAPDPVP